jgi:ribosome maturation factor RimP
MSPFSLQQTEETMIPSESDIRSMIEANVAERGCFIVEIKVTAGKIRVYLDKKDGVNVSDCAYISRQLEAFLEESGALETHDLEVSSPGLDYPLRMKEQYQINIGRNLKIITQNNAERKGVLQSAEAEGIEIEEKITEREGKKKKTRMVKSFLPYSEIKEAKIEISFK